MKKIFYALTILCSLSLRSAENNSWSERWKNLKAFINPYSALSFNTLKYGFKTEADKQRFHRALNHILVPSSMKQTVADKAFDTQNKGLLSEAIKAGAAFNPYWLLQSHCDAECIKTYGNKNNLNLQHRHLGLRSLPGSTPLHVRVQHVEKPEIIESLIKSGANPLQADMFGNTPVHLAMKDITEPTSDSSRNVDLERKAIRYTEQNVTPAENITRRLEYLKAFAKKASSSDILMSQKNKEGKTPLDILDEQKDKYCSYANWISSDKDSASRCSQLQEFEQKLKEAGIKPKKYFMGIQTPW